MKNSYQFRINNVLNMTHRGVPQYPWKDMMTAISYKCPSP